MKDILFAVNATFPIVLTVMVGYFLKKIGLVDASLASAMNKLVFKVFLPSMLFLNVYKIESFADIDFSFVWYTLGATALLFGLALFSVRLFAAENPKRGALLQSVFRANYALVGIPLATSLFGERHKDTKLSQNMIKYPFFVNLLKLAKMVCVQFTNTICKNCKNIQSLRNVRKTVDKIRFVRYNTGVQDKQKLNRKRR